MGLKEANPYAAHSAGHMGTVACAFFIGDASAHADRASPFPS
jgi:hypothetical protein